jgi:hypothetical protein
MISCSRVLPEKFIVARLNQEFVAFCRTQSSIFVFTTAQPFNLFRVTYTNPHSNTICLYDSINFIAILPPTSKSLKWFFLVYFWTKNLFIIPICFSYYPTPHPPHFSLIWSSLLILGARKNLLIIESQIHSTVECFPNFDYTKFYWIKLFNLTILSVSLPT